MSKAKLQNDRKAFSIRRTSEICLLSSFAFGFFTKTAVISYRFGPQINNVDTQEPLTVMHRIEYYIERLLLLERIWCSAKIQYH
jgi:hypothetical protein